jgi:hypothetical protein
MATKELLEAIDADEAKKVVDAVLDVAAEIAALTPWPTDDKVVATAKSLLGRPLVFRALIAMINRALPEATEAREAVDSDLLAAIAECPEGVDPVTIVTLITTLLPLIKQGLAWWKQRRNQAAPAPGPATI